ncbi:MAG: choice-of-anchor L domain-containing protein [Bacteroidota bacterium]|nr:choice-of-anchor L domain-containing protein [Bacteroidota bacterium]
MKPRLQFVLLLIATILLNVQLIAQITTNKTLTPEQLVNNYLLGGGVTVSNVTFTGSTDARGSFTAPTSTKFPIAKGIILSTGFVENASKVYSDGYCDDYCSDNKFDGSDADLDKLATGPGYNAATLEFDFVPTSNKVQFKYIFASREYPQFVGYGVNDIFGFFMNKVGSTTKTNIALIPGTTTPVSIDNVNKNTNSSYYVNNESGAVSVWYKGFTTVLTAQADVIPCQAYHIKLAIEDVGDRLYDSSVFLEAGSFSSDALSVSISPSSSIDTVAVEGCSDEIVKLQLPKATSVNDTVRFTIGGTAKMGTDYDNISNTVIIPAGQSSATITIHTKYSVDGSGLKTVVLSIPTSQCGGSVKDFTAYIKDYPSLKVVTSANTSICTGQSANLSVDATGGLGSKTYTWSNNIFSQTQTVSPSVTTTYSVSVKDGCSTVKTGSVIVTKGDVPQANAGADATVSKGSSTTLTATGGASYSWSTTATTASITVSPTVNTTYIVTVKNSAGCSATDNVVVTVVETCSANAGSNVTICSGSSTTLLATGGDTYKWSNQATTASNTVTPTANTTYTVTVTKGTCTSSASVTVTITAAPQANAGNDVTTCIGSGARLLATGADSYKWSSGGTTAMISVNPTITTTYTVTGTKGSCTASDAVVVSLINTPVVNAGNNVTICSGTSTSLTATGASNYIWSTSDVTATITVTPSITTTYIVTGTVGVCSVTSSVIVTVNNLPQASAGSNTGICKGNSTNLTATGGDTYQWSPSTGLSNLSVSNPVANPTITTTYKVTVTKATCTATSQVIVTVNSLPTANAGSDVTVGKGVSTTLTATGGTTYSWSTNAKTASTTVNPTQNTTYTVTVTDSNGCTASDNVVVTTIELCVANAGNDQTICIGGTARLTATGGDSYLWSTGESTQMISVMPTLVSTYTVTVTKGSCTSSDAVVVSLVNPPTVSAGSDVTICNGATTSLTGTGALSYSWNTGSLTSTITVNPTATTTYTVTGTSGVCSVTSSVVVTVNNLVVSAGNDVTVCAGSGTRLLASGGDSYKWSTGATTTMISVNPTATSTYTITATKGQCYGIAKVVVTVANLTVNAGQDKNICSGTTTSLSAIGGTTFKWSTGETTSTINVSPTISTTYIVTATSGNCNATDAVVVNVYPALTLNAGVDRTINSGSSVTLTATGASNYSWSTGGTTSSISVNPTVTTTYVVTGSNAACSTTDNLIVTVNSLPVASAGQNITICRLDTPRLTATGGIYYKWSTGSRLASISVNPTVTTTYKVSVTSSTGAVSTAQVIVYVVISNAYAGVDKTVCLGSSTTLTATGGQTYRWITGATTQSITVTPNVMKLYVVTASVAAQRTCTSSDVVIVRVNKVAASAGPNVLICKGLSTTLTANGGVKYVWNTSATTQSIVVNPTVTSTYTVSVTSAQSCTAAAKVTVSVAACKSNDEMTETGKNVSVTDNFEIFPNPFNEISNITYQLNDAGNVTISVYDIIGNKVSVIMNEKKEKGNYNINWNRNGLNSGLYLIELRTGNSVQLKKVTIM